MDTKIIIFKTTRCDEVSYRWQIKHPHFVIYSNTPYYTANICKRWAKYHHTKLFKPYAVTPYRRLSYIEDANLEKIISLAFDFDLV